MPVGKVFDAREGQVLFSPVSNYYQGKALRADISLREKQGEALQMEIDSAPAAAAAAARKEQRDINKEERLQAKADREAQEYADKGHAQEVADIGKGFTAYTAAVEKDPSLRKEAYALLNEHLTEVVGPEKAQAFIKKFDRNNNGFYEPNEEALIKAAGFASEKVKLTPRNFITADGTPTAGFANTVTGENIATSDTPIAPQAGQGDIDQRTGPQVGAVDVAIRDQAAAVNTFGDMAVRMMGILNSVEGANTLTAQLANVGNRLKNELNIFVNTFDVKFEAGDDALNVSHYGDTFSAAGLAGASPRVKNGFLALAIQKATASGLGTGRALSDFDIKQQLLTLGQNQSDPDIVARLFSDSMGSLTDNIKNKAAAHELPMPEIRKFDFGFGANNADSNVVTYDDGTTVTFK